MFYKNKKQLLVFLATSMILTFSYGICAFADENTDTDTSSISAEDTCATGDETMAEENPRVILAGSSEKKTQADADNSLTDAEEAAETETAETETAETPDNTPENDNTNSTDNNMISLGVFRTTAYCPCYACSEGYGRHTCTGATARSNHTIAVDPRVIPFGSRVMIDGIVYTAEDRGGAVKGNHIDIFFDSHAQTWQYGSRATEVFLLV